MVTISSYHLWRGEMVSGFVAFCWSSISKILIIDQENMFFKNHLEIIDKYIYLRSERNCPNSTGITFFFFFLKM